MNSLTQTANKGGVQKSSLHIYEPFNIVVFLSFFSPIILATSITGLSFIFQNFKGFIYLGFLLATCIVRNYIYAMSGSTPNVNDGTICSTVQYGKYGNPTFSAFVFSFTLMYLSLPMFSNGAPNFWIFSAILIYFFIDLFIKLYKKCVVQIGDLLLNIGFGLATAALIVTCMYAGGSSKFLFFNEVSSNKEVCSQPSKQTFKCNVFKNGELIGSSNA